MTDINVTTGTSVQSPARVREPDRRPARFGWRGLKIMDCIGHRWVTRHSGTAIVTIVTGTLLKLFSLFIRSLQLTMHSRALSDNGRWELSNLGGLCQAGAAFWTSGSMHFPLLVQFRPLSCPNTKIMWENIRNIFLFTADQNVMSLTSSCSSHGSWLTQNQNQNRTPLYDLQTETFVCNSSLGTIQFNNKQ